MNKEKRDAISARLDQIARLNGGLLTPSKVLEDAKSETSPLHDHFEWDDSKAAGQYRLDQARGLIRSVRIEIQTEERIISTVRYVHDPSIGHEQGYRDVTKLRGEKDIARDAVLSELRLARSAMERAQEVALALGLSDEIDSLQQRLNLIYRGLEAA